MYGYFWAALRPPGQSAVSLRTRFAFPYRKLNGSCGVLCREDSTARALFCSARQEETCIR
jgi:hypothetical protein